MIRNDSTKRFSDRVEDYVRYRPAYPDGLVQVLEEVTGLEPAAIIADIGSGTGISSIPFLKKGYTVVGVEPNKEMREAAEATLSAFPLFKSVDGMAEKTNLPGNSIDVIICAQAFHWFDRTKAKNEFERILKEKGHIVLVWNERSMRSAFQQEYEEMLLRHIEEYRSVNHRNIDEKLIAGFFAPQKMKRASIDNSQVLSLGGLTGRLRSSSYFPKSGVQHDLLMQELTILFDKYEKENLVTFEYETKIYWC